MTDFQTLIDAMSTKTTEDLQAMVKLAGREPKQHRDEVLQQLVELNSAGVKVLMTKIGLMGLIQNTIADEFRDAGEFNVDCDGDEGVAYVFGLSKDHRFKFTITINVDDANVK